jgi:hypothetical protein
MGNYKLKTHVGYHIQNVAQQAKDFANENDLVVEFDFNGVQCLVNKQTNADFLVRDFLNAHRMDWKTVGPDCVEVYSPEVEAELARRTEAASIRAIAQRALRDKKDESERALVANTINGVEFAVENEVGYAACKANNTDGYGHGIFEYTEIWARLMQERMSRGDSLIDCAEPTSFMMGYMGITGFMYGAAVSILSKHWKYGELLRKWPNKEYGQEGEGVVNPAMLTITT